MERGVLKKGAAAGIGLCVLAFAVYFGTQGNTEVQAGMFSWDEETVENPSEMEGLIRKLDIVRWYQEFPENPDVEKTEDFINYMQSNGVSVDALVGSVDWGFEADGSSLITSIETIHTYNRSVKKNSRIPGIMVDVEPYVTKKFKSDKEKYMAVYVRGMERAYAFARERNIRFIVCIPRNYEEMGLGTQLEELISGACDEVAVMNYGRGDEEEMIATEAALAEKYRKSLHCILEFQDIGKHGLTENETYREEGIEEALEVWRKVRISYPDIPIIADYHWTRPLLEMLKEED